MHCVATRNGSLAKMKSPSTPGWTGPRAGSRMRATVLLVILCNALAMTAVAQEAKHQVPKPGTRSIDHTAARHPAAQKGTQTATGRERPSLAQDYCRAIRDAAREARHAVQLRQIDSLKKELDDRLVKIDRRVAELKEWFGRREEFSNSVSAQLVGIYAVMRPESASAQLTKMDETTAAAILSRLEARAASAILNDMPPDTAARLVTILSAAARREDDQTEAGTAAAKGGGGAAPLQDGRS